MVQRDWTHRGLAHWGRAHWGLVVLATTMMVVIMVASPAAADPADPTDYQTDIVAVDPPTPSITVESIGGDSFIRLTVASGHQVEVIGYQGEPYLRFGPDGVVEQNENSPSRWLNDDRYGEADPPATATAEAEPDWVIVATDGSYSWHDHRTHWMNPQKPPGAEPGDTVLEAVVPLVVDGADVDVAVRSTLLDPPSPLGPVGGAVVAALTMVAGWLLARLFGVSLMALLWSGLAAVVGVLAFSAVPSETEPSILMWILPLVGLAVLGVGLLLRAQGKPWEIWSILTLAAGVELMLWAWLRKDSLNRALIPTTAPYWLDRVAVAASAVAGLAAVAVVVSQMAKPAGDGGET